MGGFDGGGGIAVGQVLVSVCVIFRQCLSHMLPDAASYFVSLPLPLRLFFFFLFFFFFFSSEVSRVQLLFFVCFLKTKRESMCVCM